MSAIRDALIVTKNLDRLKNRQLANVKEAIRVSQAAVSNEAKRLVPVKTGFLQSSIQPGEIKVIPILNLISGEVRADADYALWVETGTSIQMAQPFLGPAIFGEMNRFRQRVANAMKV